MSFWLAWTIAQWMIRVAMTLVILRRGFLPTTALAWLGLVYLQPEAGVAFYILLGSNRLARRRLRRYHRVVIARRGSDRLPRPSEHVTRPDIGPIYQRVILQAE